MSADLRLVPALVFAWCAAAGSLVAAQRFGLGTVGWGATAALAGAVGAAWFMLRHPDGRVQWLTQVVACCGVLAAVAASATLQLADRQRGGVGEVLRSGGAVTVWGVVASTPQPAAPGQRWGSSGQLEVRRLEYAGDSYTARVGLVMLGELDVRRGENVVVSGTLRALPATSTAAGLLLDATVISRSPASGVTAGIARARDAFLDLTDPLSPQGRALVPGVAVGDDSRLSATLEAAMRRTSLSHLTAVSGAHVSLVLLALAYALGRFARHTRVIGALLALSALVALVGPEPSVIRAAGMGSIALLALAQGRPPAAVPALAGGIMLTLVLNPWLALQIGFALSATATASILLLTRPLTVALAGPDPAGLSQRISVALAVPLAAGIACAPILVLLAPEVSLIGVLANTIALPAVAPSTVLGLLGVILALPAPALSLLAARGAELFTGWIAGVALTCARLPCAAVPWPAGIAGSVLLAVAGAGAIVVILRRPPTLWRAALGVLLLAAACLAPNLTRTSWAVWQCDVGQGSALLVRSGPGRAVMVDVGPEEGRSQDCLARAGIHRLDLLILTHPHADHVGNLPAVLASVPVQRIVTGPQVPTRDGDSLSTWLAAGVAEAHAELEVISAPDTGRAGDVTWRVLWPYGDRVPADENDASLAIILSVDTMSVMSLADLGVMGQRGLSDAMRAGGFSRVDVVTVAHHGSQDQDAGLAELIRPGVALISTGENTYGHPTDTAIELYTRVSGSVLRTDHLGDIAIRGG